MVGYRDTPTIKRFLQQTFRVNPIQILYVISEIDSDVVMKEVI